MGRHSGAEEVLTLFATESRFMMVIKASGGKASKQEEDETKGRFLKDTRLSSKDLNANEHSQKNCCGGYYADL